MDLIFSDLSRWMQHYLTYRAKPKNHACVRKTSLYHRHAALDSTQPDNIPYTSLLGLQPTAGKPKTAHSLA